MLSYLIIAAAIFAANAAYTFVSRIVPNKQVLINIALFPLVWLGTGMPISDLPLQMASGIFMFLLGIIAFVKLGFGGGVGRAAALCTLWFPISAALLNLFWITPIVGVLLGGIIAKIERTKDIEHYAAIFFACCAGLLAYEHSQSSSGPVKNTIIAEQIEPSLRGLSNP